MAFTTTTGAGGTSLIGTSGVDSTTITTGLAVNTFIQAEGDNDVVTVTAAQGGLTGLQLFGGQGNDVLTLLSALSSSNVKAGDGADTINLAALNTSTVSGLDGIDTISLSGAVAVNSLVNGNSGNDVFTNAAGASVTQSTIAGGQGQDTMGTNTVAITFGAGAVINGQDGDDTLAYLLAANMGSGAAVRGGQGADTITFAAAAFNATAYGDDGRDTITTSNGNDTIYGGNDNDTLNGGTADAVGDTLTGGGGVDTFNALAAVANSAAQASNVGASISTNAANITAGAALAFNGGLGSATTLAGQIDVITDFEFGATGDVLRTSAGAGAAFDNTIGGVIAAATVYAYSGTYTASTGRFVLAADGTGPDTIVFTANAAGTLTTSVLSNVNNTTLVAGNFG